MFSKPVVRSVAEIKKGLLSRAFQKGGRAEYEKMKLLIEWRLAACRHYADQAVKDLETNYKLDKFNDTPQEASRWINAFNLVEYIEGRKNTLRLTPSYDQRVEALKAEIEANAERVKHHNKVMDIIWNAPEFNLRKTRSDRDNTARVANILPSSFSITTRGLKKDLLDTVGFRGGIKPTLH